MPRAQEGKGLILTRCWDYLIEPCSRLPSVKGRLSKGINLWTLNAQRNDSADKIEEQASSKISENNQKAEDANSNLCSICYTCDNEVKLNKCEHSLCKTCYDRIMKTNPICPFCKTIYGVLTGDQPKNGLMSHIITSHILPGFPNSNTIQINYKIPNYTVITQPCVVVLR